MFCVFLISLLTYQIVCNFNNLFSLKHLVVSLLLLVLLAVVKPLFYPLVLIALGVIVISKAKTLIANPKQLGILILTLTPLLLQLGMMKYKYDKFTVSTIGDLTWRKYITAQVISEVNHFKEDQIMTAVKMGEEMPKDKLDALYQKHSSIYFKNWINNIHSNLANESSLLKFPAGYDHQKLYDFMISTNLAYRKMHILFFILYLISAVIWIIRKNYNILIGTSALMLLCFYIFGTSGIAFWQGDRIVLTKLPLFFVSYAFLLATIVDLIQTKISQRKAERKI